MRAAIAVIEDWAGREDKWQGVLPIAIPY